MEVSRLLKDELVHEVGVRGYVAESTDTVASLSKQLKNLLSAEERGEELTDALIPIDVDSEVCTIDFKLTEVSLMLSALQDSDRDKNQKQAVRARTLMSHLNRRTNRLWNSVGGDSDQRAVVKPLFVALKQCVALFRTLGESPVYAASTVLSMSESVHKTEEKGSVSEGESEPKDGESQSRKKGSNGGNSENRRPPDFHKWGISFSGTDDQSVLSFIVDVEEKAAWKGVPFNTLLLGASEFFKDRAKTWFRSMKSKLDSWEELKVALRKEFLPLDYQENLWDELRSRKQGKKELMGEYVANMVALFERLETLEPITDEVKLSILKKNLAPFYLSRLALTSILSIDQLKTLGKELEVSRSRIETYDGKEKPKPVEPEFAVKNSAPRKTFKVSAVETSSGDGNAASSSSTPPNSNSGSQLFKTKCWNCQDAGHRFSECPVKEKRIFCHGCGKGGVISPNCPKCKSSRKTKGAGKE